MIYKEKVALHKLYKKYRQKTAKVQFWMRLQKNPTGQGKIVYLTNSSWLANLASLATNCLKSIR